MGFKRTKNKIIIVSDRKEVKDYLCLVYQTSFQVLEADSGHEALDLLEHYGTDITAILMEFSDSSREVFVTMEKLKEMGITEIVPVVAVIKEIEVDLLERVLDLGVSDIIQEPFYPGLIKRRLKNLTHMNAQKTETEKLKIEASTDPLTQLLNRRALEHRASQILGDSKGLLALCLMDIDNFKTFNDVYGHSVGDEVLAAVSRRLLAHIRRQDVIGRVGGDEFVILLRNIRSPQDAKEKMEAICTLFMEEAGEQRVSSSVGIALFPADGTEYRTLFDKADKALYQAKNMGKNRCVIYEEKFQQIPFCTSVSEVDQSLVKTKSDDVTDRREEE
jgi:diguanylate cyclase (GGDEF)-like protein